MREIHNLMTIGEVAGSFGVCVATVRRWCKNGKFSRVIRTIKNQRRFDPDEVHEMLHPTRGKRIMVGYARVSSYDQRSDLTAQAERLSQYGCQPVIKDLGSGLNCKKPGLKRLLKLLLTGRVGALVVTHDDRLLRFGTELFHRSPHGHPYRHLR
jgi:ISSoc2, resolvase